MSSPHSIAELDLTPLPGKTYWNTEREPQEDFIYFLLVDRFHDDQVRTSADTTSRSVSNASSAQLKQFCGGTLKGILKHLDYIDNLGCTALWLSPVFENNPDPDKYHGYAIQNYLSIDPRFGTKQDLMDLVQAAHDRHMRVYLDAVVNHAGDIFAYPGDFPYFYAPGQDGQGTEFMFGSWRKTDRPVPLELKNPNYYFRMGQIREGHWDDYPETQNGDFFSLKGFKNDESADGLALQEILIQAHCYWIREADIDGLRMDAVKHMGELAVARFCSQIREYAYRLGKRSFFLFGELVAGDDGIDRYIGPNTSTKVDQKTVYFGINSVLDFPLNGVLPGVIKGFGSPLALFERYERQRNRALSRGELGRYLVTFLDNHDQIGSDPKRRFAAEAPDQQVIAGIGYLLCALGTPCIYYGTEQGLGGKGNGDEFIREPLFDLADPTRNFLNPACTIYQKIAELTAIYRQQPALRFGRMYFREISGNGFDFGLPQGQPCTLAFSRLLGGEEILVAYNTSSIEKRQDYVIIDSNIHQKNGKLTYLYGKTGTVSVLEHRDPGNAALFVQLELEPLDFVILI